jgi:hypothetical protein
MVADGSTRRHASLLPLAAADVRPGEGIACRALHGLQETRLRVQRHHLAESPIDRALSDEVRNAQRRHWTVSGAA